MSLASPIASASSLKVMMGATGPKISLRKTGMSVVTLVKMVG